MKKVDGTYNIQDDIFKGKTEMKISFHYKELAKLGLTVQDVAQTVRTAYDGMIATSIETGDELLDFRVKVDDSFQKDKAYLLSLKIPNKQNRLIRLGDVAYIIERKSMANIAHYEGERAISVNAKVDEDKITSAQANLMLQDYFETFNDNYPKAKLEFEGEAKQTKETLGDVAYSFGLAILLILFVLILLFKSPTQPLIIIAVVPFGIIGALVAFTLHGMPLSFMGIIGIVGLSGVVVNDSVIMIDLINTIFKNNKGDRKSVIENIVEGASERLRPVLLTTITTVAGLLPTVYGILGVSDMIAPVAMAMAYGLIFATTLTLLFIPSLYMVNNDIISLFGFGKRKDKKNEK
ncbi:MAG: efflux RND transporter permease subunit [Candidatus Zixiibacteriota bacterium]